MTLIVAKVIAFFSPVPIQPNPQTAPAVAAPETTSEPVVNRAAVRTIAQLAPPAVAAVEQQSTPVQASCAGALPSPSPEPKLEYCEQSSVNLAEYVTPSCPAGGCGVVNSSSVGLTFSYIGGVNNQVFPINSTTIKQQSNDVFFLYSHQGGYISLLQDTIWGGGPAGGFFVCDGTNEQAFYRVYDEGGNWGNKQYPETASCGSTWSHTSVLKTYKKVSDSGFDINAPGADPMAPESQLTACNVSGQTGIPSTNSGKLIFQGAAKCNGVDFDMIAVQNVSGAGAGEVNMYCKYKDGRPGPGLCAFYQTLDFSKPENQPGNWPGQDICALKAGGSRATLPTYFEYNIQRECGQTPVKVLNNFLDEYSVSCVPEADYILELVRPDKCSRTARGCGDWNVAGDLRFSADGSLFGLFRNQSAVESRYNTMNGLKDKNRQESIESYLTAKVDHIPLSQQSSTTQFTSQNRPGVIDLSSYQSPLYKLSTLEQQCELVFDKLRAVKELCEPFNRIEGEEGSECAINQFLPNTSLRYTDMLSALTDPSDSEKSLCIQLMNPDSSNANAVALRDQILSIDPAMEVAYRPAFIVVATLVGNPLQQNPEFLTQNSGGGLDRSNFWQVDYMEVKVPTFGSDFLYKKNNGSASNPARAGSTYRDPLRFLGDILTTPEIQEKYLQEEENDRNAIRAKAATFDPNVVTSGEVIGMGGVPIRCRGGEGQYSVEACDNIAKALITFINSSTVVPVTPGEGANGESLTRQYSPPRLDKPQGGWLPASKCEVFEKNMYGNSLLTENPVDEKYRQAEQATSIGSKLEAIDVGRYQKKKEGEAEVVTNVPQLDANPAASNFGRTQVFFVSPHNYTLLYAQNAMLELLSDDQKEAFLKNENFNSVLKTAGLDQFQSGKTESTYWTLKGTGENGPPGPADPLVSDSYSVQEEMDRKQEDGKTLDSPLLWQVAGSVANIPTRVFAFITNTVNSKMYKFTLGCTGSYATENWLLGRCTEATLSSSPGPSSTPIPPEPGGSDKCVAVRVSPAEAEAAAAELRANLPGQQHQSSSFAGWDRYYGVEGRPQDQHLFYPDCNGGQLCYEYILNQITSRTNLNPYLVMAIAMNETGGLISAKPGFVGPHFGCGLGGSGSGGQIISDGSIESKLQCLMDFFDRNSALSDNDALKRYGYGNGVSENNLVKIIGILSNGQQPAQCEGTP